MKNQRIILTCIFTLTYLVTLAQNSGVYLSAADFKSGKLAYAIDCKTEKHKIKLNEFFGKDYITVVHNKQPHKLIKKDIFGYRDCNDITYRFVGNDRDYAIMNPKEEILLYVLQIPGSKNSPAQTYYFFSRSADGEVKELMLTNLRNAFPDNHKFHDMLDSELGSGNLAEYDSYHKVYKVNRIYSNSLNQ